MNRKFLPSHEGRKSERDVFARHVTDADPTRLYPTSHEYEQLSV